MATPGAFGRRDRIRRTGRLATGHPLSCEGRAISTVSGLQVPRRDVDITEQMTIHREVLVTLTIGALCALGACGGGGAKATAATPRTTEAKAPEPTTTTQLNASGSVGRREPRILSASWGTDNAVGCPTGEKGLDNIPVTFNWFIDRSSIQTTDFQVVRSDGSIATPTCALQFPPDESDEAQTVNLIGNFGDSVHGPMPVAIRVVGALQGKAPGTNRWSPIPPLPEVHVEPLSGGPYIVDAWTLTPAIYQGDANRCKVGTTFVRVMWSNGLTAYPTGAEVGAPVVASYRALYKLPNGRVVAVAPLDVADLHDHSTSANADNMHDLCLPSIARGAKLTGVTIGGGLIQDPNGDPNVGQKFRAPRLG